MKAETDVRDGILDAQAALLANARTWKRLAQDGQVPTAVWRELLGLIEGERRTVGYLRAVAAAAEEASARPRHSGHRPGRVRGAATRTMRCAG